VTAGRPYRLDVGYASPVMVGWAPQGHAAGRLVARRCAAVGLRKALRTER